jgi:prepilin-type N-terminal cleavage/methylation domain-containing protein
MRLNSAPRDGLSLIEVLASLAIFLMALTALTFLVNNSSSLAAEAQYRARCAQLARSKINEMAAGAVPLQSQAEASFDDEPLYRWSADVADGGVTGLFNVTVTVVYRPDDPYPTKVSTSRMILDPKVTGSTQDVPAAPADSGNESGSDSSQPSGGSSSQPSGSGGSSSGGASSGGAKSGGSSPMTPSSGGGKSGGSSPTTQPSSGASVAPKTGGSTTTGGSSGGATGGSKGGSTGGSSGMSSGGGKGGK